MRCIRERDLLAKEQRQAEKSSCTPVMPSSSRFFARMSQAEWLRLLHSLHLFENSEAGPYLCRSLEPRATNPPRLKLGKISNRHLSARIEVDAAYQSNKNPNGTTKLTAENGSLESSADNPTTNQNVDGATSLNDERIIQPNVMKLSSPHVVPMQGRNFVTSSPHCNGKSFRKGRWDKYLRIKLSTLLQLRCMVPLCAANHWLFKGLEVQSSTSCLLRAAGFTHKTFSFKFS